MVTLIATQTHMPQFHNRLLHLNNRLFPSLVCVLGAKKGARNYKKATIFSLSHRLLLVKSPRNFEDNNYSSLFCGCKQIESDGELEAEIMEFMEKSRKPTMFPTKEELVRAGRKDLVEAIKKRGGWFSLGWENENDELGGQNVKEAVDFDIEEPSRNIQRSKEINNNSLNENGKRLSSDSSNSLQLASSSGRPLESSAEEDTGVEGILSRLEKQRSTDFRINLGKHGYQTTSSSVDEKIDLHLGNRADDGNNNRFTSSLPFKGVMNNSSGKITPDIYTEAWRTWSIQQKGFEDTEFEAAEISYGKNEVEQNKEAVGSGITASTEDIPENPDRQEFNHIQIRTRLRHLECELNTALHSLRSKRESVSPEFSGSSSSDLQNLPDAWEFKENEHMKAQETLRSTRAKLAVLEGKMALAIIDAQRKVEEKQKRIDRAHKALHVLRTVSIIWPNSASEVLLAGSFDGWTTQRKMEKSETGIFSLRLKLYPGRYEIKFIVDGIWKVDPLRPIVHNNGHENNLLTVT